MAWSRSSLRPWKAVSLFSIALGGAFSGACSVDTEGLFGDATGGVGGTGQGGATNDTSSMTTASMTTDVTTTGSMSTVTSTAAGAMCGNDALDPGEECDGAALGGATCADLGFTNPAGTKCTASCTLDYGDCLNVCGNGQIEPNEDCDDGNTSELLDGCSKTCKALGTSCAAAVPVALSLGTTKIAGTTALADDTFQSQNAMGCMDTTGGDLVLAISPTEAGFVTAWLPRASTSFDSVLYVRNTCDDAASQALCNDNYLQGGSNNDDGGELVSVYVPAGHTIYLFVDGYAGESGTFELSLDLSKGDNCADPVPLTVEGSSDIVLLGSTAGFANDASTTTTPCFGAGAGPDVVYQVTTASSDTYNFATSASFNSVTYARSSCGDSATQLVCDSPGLSNDSDVDVDATTNVPTYVWVDGTSGASGTYRLTISH